MNETINFLSQHGALVLAATVFAEQIGLPIPALPFLIAAGALVGTGQMGLGMAIVSAGLAAMAGDLELAEPGDLVFRPALATDQIDVELLDVLRLRRRRTFVERAGRRTRERPEVSEP